MQVLDQEQQSREVHPEQPPSSRDEAVSCSELRDLLRLGVSMQQQASRLGELEETVRLLKDQGQEEHLYNGGGASKPEASVGELRSLLKTSLLSCVARSMN